MMRATRTPDNRLTLLLALIGTMVLVGAGLAVSRDLAEELMVGVGVVLAGVIVSAVSPAAGVSAVLLATPTMHNLYSMPRGEFTLLEIAILTATMGIAIRLVIEALRTGWDSLGDLFLPAQVIVPVGMLLGAAALTIFTLADPAYRNESLREIRTVIVEPLLFLAVARMAMRRTDVRHIAGTMLIVAGIAVSVYAVVQIVFNLGGLPAGSLTRATATYTNPNNLAFFIERTLLLTVGVGVVRPRWWPLWIASLIQMAGLALTFSRGALVALVAGVAILLVLRGLYRWLLLVLVGGIGVAGIGVMLFPERFIDAGGTGREFTRSTIWRASLRMALDHPLFGVGPDQFLYQYARRYVEPMGWMERGTSHSHNLFFDVWLRLGVPGLAAMTSLGVGLLWWAKRHFQVIRNDIWAMGAIGALVGGLAHGLFDNAFFLPDLATLTWFFVALLITVPPATTQISGGAPVDTRTTMERTWPDRPTNAGAKPGVAMAWGMSSVVLIPGMMVVFAIAPVVSQNAYVPFLMIALAGLVMILNPAVGVAGVVVSIPIQDAVLIPFVSGELTITQIVLFGVVLGWLVTISRYRIWLDAVLVGFMAVLAAFAISLVEMDSPALWAGESYRWAVAGLFYVICRSVLTSWQRTRVVLFGVMLSVIGTSGYALYELAEWGRSDHAGGWAQFRAVGAFGVPNPLAAYIELTVPLLLILAILGFSAPVRDRIGVPFWLVTIAASVAGMLTLGLTESRGGLVGMAFAMVVVLLILPRHVMFVTTTVGGLLIAGFLLTPVGQAQIDRFTPAIRSDIPGTRMPHQGMWGREALWLAGVDMIADKPWTGVGAGEFDYHYREYVREWADRAPAGQAHNAWLQMGAQAGIPGIVAFMVWLGASLHSVCGAFRRTSEPLARMLAWGAFAAVVAFTLHSLVDYLNVLSLGLQVSAVTAMGLNLTPTPLSAYQSSPPRMKNVTGDRVDVVLAT